LIWETENPVLKASEFGYDLDSGLFKIGDGVTAWNNLPYFVSENSLGEIVIPPSEGGGAALLHGEGVPSGATGVDNDFYLDTNNHRLYGPKTSGVWGAGVLLVGPAGSDGVSFVYLGAWVSGTSYNEGEWVSFGGSLYACNGNVVSNTVVPPLDAGWDLASTVHVPSPFSGAVYFPHGATNTLTFSNIGAGASRLAPLFVPVGSSIAGLLVEVTTGEASAVGRLCLYSDTGSGYPNEVLDQGTIACDTNGMKSYTFGTPVKGQGLMWVGLKAEIGTTVAVRSVNSPSDYVAVDSTVSASNSLACGYVCSSGQNGVTVKSPFPVRLGTGFGYAVSVPRVGVLLA
jgi:hypothetical protein